MNFSPLVAARVSTRSEREFTGISWRSAQLKDRGIVMRRIEARTVADR